MKKNCPLIRGVRFLVCPVNGENTAGEYAKIIGRQENKTFFLKEADEIF